MVQAGLGKKQDPVSKINRAKRAGRVAQMVEYLPNKCAALSSNSSTTTTTKKKNLSFMWLQFLGIMRRKMMERKVYTNRHPGT
jgi:hypothetical protein